MIRTLSILFCLFFLISCGSKTTVILLPDDDGKTGAVVVRNQTSETTLDQPYTYTQVTQSPSKLSNQSIDPERVRSEYLGLIEAEPEKPDYFILYFELNSTLLNEESLAVIPKIIDTAKRRTPSKISIIGHADSTGSKEHNMTLSLKRAKAVEKILLESDIDIKNLQVSSHGDNDPLVTSGNDEEMGRNRRVEIMIR